VSQTAEHPEPDGIPRHDVPNAGRSGYTLIDGRQVHYLEWGHGRLPAVLCLHGGGQTAYMFEDLGAALAGRYHVLAIDLPHHGDSDPVDGHGPRAYAETLPPLLEAFGIETPVLVGASMGGMTSIFLGATRPELVRAVVLIDVGHQLEAEGVERILAFLSAHESFGSLEEAADAIAEYLPLRERPTDPRRLTRNMRQRPDGRWEWKHGVYRRVQGPEGAAHLRNWRQVVAGLEEAAKSLRCPVLVLRGSQSDVLSDEGAEAVTALIPGARLEVIERAGHLAAGDNPRSTVALISSFLDGLDGAP
jgi:pimeloyl-ACP methyl ester carboxylesterase